MTITLNAEQIARIQAVYAERQTAPQLAGKETIDELLEKVIEYGILHYEYQRKHNKKAYAEYKQWKQSTK